MTENKRKNSSKKEEPLTRAQKDRLKDTPYSSIKELEDAEQRIAAYAWQKVETARRIGALLSKPRYRYVFDRLQKGIACNYGENEDLLRIYADHETGLVRVDIAEGIEQTNINSEVMGLLISNLSKTVQSTYYAVTGIPFADALGSNDDLISDLIGKELK